MMIMVAIHHGAIFNNIMTIESVKKSCGLICSFREVINLYFLNYVFLRWCDVSMFGLEDRHVQRSFTLPIDVRICGHNTVFFFFKFKMRRLSLRKDTIWRDILLFISL